MGVDDPAWSVADVLGVLDDEVAAGSPRLA
jgi:hypothetical protein